MSAVRLPPDTDSPDPTDSLMGDELLPSPDRGADVLDAPPDWADLSLSHDQFPFVEIISDSRQ